ncbi:MAG: hypothetical protein IPK88_17850 [Saprospiraceae bacterium]|nr:hypothetical protein [Candidatus Defluviibacterium haderslevense]
MFEVDLFDQSLSPDSLAAAIVERAFAGKYEFLGTPYSDHLFRVAEKCVDESTKVVALLHDLLEDCPTWSAERLLKYFPQDIVHDVVLLTNDTYQSYEVYIQSIYNGSQRVLEVKIADLEDNMDLKRLPELREKDVQTLIRYHEFWHYCLFGIKTNRYNSQNLIYNCIIRSKMTHPDFENSESYRCE